MSSINVCVVCSVSAPYKCTGCKSVSYCGNEHQKQHWKIHKTDCRPYEITHTRDRGRTLKASRDIPKGANIFSEPPLIYGPKTTISDEELELKLIPCIGCYKLIRIGVSQCLKCKWPACSTTCAGLTDPNLHGVECPILCLKYGPSLDNDSDTLFDFYRSDVILPLKCLLLQRSNPKKWKQLMEMESHHEERLNSEYYLDAEQRVVSHLQTNFIEPIRIAEQQTGKVYLEKSDAEIIHKICGIIEVNFMMISLQNGEEVSGVYPTGCILEHSCVPNCYYTFDIDNGYKICVKSGKNLEKGEHLKIMYTHILWGTQMRREHLRATKYFDCNCERCADPTEFGTYLSALKCIGPDTTTCGGYQLPLNPLNDKSDWACNVCPVQLTNDQTSFIISKMSEEVDNVTVNRQTSVTDIEMLIEKFSQLLHPNHYLMFTLKHTLIQMYGSQPGYLPNQLSVELLNSKLLMCNGLLDLVTILDSASIRVSFYTSIILFEIHNTILELEFRKTDTKEYNLSNLRLAVDHLERAKNIIQIEMDTPAGQKLFTKLCKTLEETQKLLVTNHLII